MKLLSFREATVIMNGLLKQNCSQNTHHMVQEAAAMLPPPLPFSLL